jgi:AraC-like DNA-binding protein
MLGSGSSIFTEADEYQAHLSLPMDLLVVQPGRFRARLTWVGLPQVHLLHAREALSRVAYVSLPPDPVFVTFPTDQASRLIYDGVSLQWGDIMFHSPGERFHQRIAAPSTWGSIALTLPTLLAYSRILNGSDLAIPARGQVLRLPLADRRQLLQVHGRAARVAERNLNRLAHPEVARSLEQDLIVALVASLVTGEPQSRSTAVSRCAAKLVQFEEALAASPNTVPQVSEICDAMGISQRALRACCLQVLGMSAADYLYLRRLRQAWQALLKADAAPEAVREVINRYRFADFRRLAAAYRRAFGEKPPDDAGHVFPNARRRRFLVF